MKTILSLIVGLFSVIFYAQENNEQIFKNDLNTITEDAEKGFQKSRDDCSGKSCNSSLNFLGVKNTAFILHSEAQYWKYSNKTDPEEFFFIQKFDSLTNQGKFVYENSERIFDEYASKNNLSKKVEKEDKWAKKSNVKYRSIIYSKKRRKVFQLFFTLGYETVSIYIHSDLRPNDLPNYLGCLVLYNIQSSILASANTYYVYGNSLASADILYAKIISDKDETFKRLFVKYEWMPNASRQQVNQKMKSLGIQEYSQIINPDGFTIR